MQPFPPAVNTPAPAAAPAVNTPAPTAAPPFLPHRPRVELCPRCGEHTLHPYSTGTGRQCASSTCGYVRPFEGRPRR